MDYKIIQYLYQLDAFIGLLKMMLTVKLNSRNLQGYQKKALKIAYFRHKFCSKVEIQFQKIEFKGICLKQDSVSFLHKNAVNYIFLIMYIQFQEIKTQNLH